MLYYNIQCLAALIVFGFHQKKIYICIMTNKFYSEAICMTLLQNYVLTNRRVKGMTVLPFYKFASDERYFMITVHMEDCTVKAYTNANIVHIDSNERMNVQLDTLQISEQKEMYSKIIRYLHDNKK